MKCPICNEEVATIEQAEKWGPEFAHSRCVVAYNHGKADAAPEAPAQNGHLADDERVAALCTLSYAAGMKAGWNYCASEDNEGFERSQKSVGEAIRILKAHRAAAEAPAQGEARKDRMQKVRDFIQADADLARGIASTEAPAQEKSNG